MPSKPSIGGQAVMDGVMMRGPESWAVAVRKPNTEIVVESHPLPDYPKSHGWTRKPFLRGVWVLVESMMIGFQALKISAAYSLEEEDGTAEDASTVDKTLNYSLGIGMVLITAAFVTIPAAISKWGGARLGVDGDLAQNLLEGGIRMGIFLGYVILIGLVPDIRRVFQYHGAEHKTIYAYENDDPLEPSVIDTYSTLHVRCGTNFLFVVMILAMVANFSVDLVFQGFPIVVKLLVRVMIIPLVAGCSYEVIRAAGKDDRSFIFRAVSLPGLAVQKITTRAPTLEQIEVAIKAMEGVIQSIKTPEAVSATVPVYEVRAAHDPLLHPEPGVEPA